MTMYHQVVQAATEQNNFQLFLLYTNGLDATQNIFQPFTGSLAPQNGDGAWVTSFQAMGGTPVIIQATGEYPGLVHNFVITIERLETTP
jgi:hypothetical protein